MAKKRQVNPFEGLDGAALAERIAIAGDTAIADALMLQALTLADFKNGGAMAHYVAEARAELIEAFKDFADINLIETDAFKVLLALQTAIKQHRHVTAFLTKALTQMQSAPQAEDTESLNDLLDDDLGEGDGDNG